MRRDRLNRVSGRLSGLGSGRASGLARALSLTLLPLLCACSHPYYVRADVFALAPTPTTPPHRLGQVERLGRHAVDGVEVADAEDTGPLEASAPARLLENPPLPGARVSWTPVFEGGPAANDGAANEGAANEGAANDGAANEGAANEGAAGAGLALPADPARGRWYFKARGEDDGRLTAIRIRIEAPGHRPLETEIPVGEHAYEEWCLVGVPEPLP